MNFIATINYCHKFEVASSRAFMWFSSLISTLRFKYVCSNSWRAYDASRVWLVLPEGHADLNVRILSTAKQLHPVCLEDMCVLEGLHRLALLHDLYRVGFRHHRRIASWAVLVGPASARCRPWCRLACVCVCIYMYVIYWVRVFPPPSLSHAFPIRQMLSHDDVVVVVVVVDDDDDGERC